jgi:hypothetical protein
MGLKDPLENPSLLPKSPEYARSPGPFEIPGLRRKLGATLWWWRESPANSSLPNSLFNREDTGNFYDFEGLFPQNLPDLPAVKGLQGFHPENRTGN